MPLKPQIAPIPRGQLIYKDKADADYMQRFFGVSTLYKNGAYEVYAEDYGIFAPKRGDVLVDSNNHVTRWSVDNPDNYIPLYSQIIFKNNRAFVMPEWSESVKGILVYDNFWPVRLEAAYQVRGICWIVRARVIDCPADGAGLHRIGKLVNNIGHDNKEGLWIPAGLLNSNLRPTPYSAGYQGVLDVIAETPQFEPPDAAQIIKHYRLETHSGTPMERRHDPELKFLTARL